tara:strand:- start:31 stop:282 length:252 start_codon:yes stop_codon:yes gene_type:complete
MNVDKMTISELEEKNLMPSYPNDPHKDLTTAELRNALNHITEVIYKKGIDNVSKETQEAYHVMSKFLEHTNGGSHRFATIYYP